MPRQPIVVAAALALGALYGCSSEPNPPVPTPDPPVVDPSQLEAPPTGKGFQFGTGAFDIEAGAEIQNCHFYKVSELAAAAGLPADKPVNMHRVQLVQKDGSHHMNLFRVRTIAGLDPQNGRVQLGRDGSGQCFVSSNWADWPLVANTQQDGQVDWTLPDGVGLKLLPDEWLMLQTHYVNATTQRTPGGAEVKVNFWTMGDDELKDELGTLFATKQSIRVCSKNPTPTFEGGCQITSKTERPIHIIGANGHFHGRGKQFDMFAWDGASRTTPPDSSRFYRSTSWDDPPMLHSPNLSVELPKGGGVWYSCSYEWMPPDKSIGCQGLDEFDGRVYKTPTDRQDCCYTFGPIVEKNEHCNIFVYYYPKQDDVACF